MKPWKMLIKHTLVGTLMGLTATSAFAVDFSSFGDLRLRRERDWDSTRSSGAMRTDRMRTRYRIRAGFKV